MISFSVIIPTCNRNASLGICLSRLESKLQNVDSNEYEVIVTDDSKECLAAELIRSKFSWAKWVEGPKKGPAANRNNGAEYAKGEWLIFLDDDCIPSNNLLVEYNNAIEIYKTTEVFEGFIGVDRKKKSFSEESPINENGGFLWSCNFMISAKLFKELGGFDSAFPYPAMEDVDLQYRIQKLGKVIRFISLAWVIHPWRLERNLSVKTKKRFQSVLYFLNKHPEKIDTLNALYFLKASKNNIVSLFKYSFKYRFKGFINQLTLSFMNLFFAIYMSVKN